MFSREVKLARAREQLKFLENCQKFCPDMVQEFKQQFEQEEASKSKFGESYAWIGINPPPGTISLYELYEKLLKVNPYKTGHALIEQNTEAGIRPHIHQLCKVSDNTRKNHIITRLSKLYGVEPQSIDVNISKNKVLVQKWQGYVCGNKKIAKQHLVEKDIEDRDKLGIPHVVEFSDLSIYKCMNC